MADQLKIDIDVSAAKASLDQLTQSFAAFSSSAMGSVGKASGAVTRLNDAMSRVRALDSKVLDSLTTLNNAISNLKAGHLASVSAALGALGGSAAGVNSAAQAAQNLAGAIKQVSVNDKTGAASVSFYKMGTAATAAAAGVRTAAAEQKRAADAARYLGQELHNAVGFMGGFGVTVGNMVRSLATLTATGQTIGSTFRLLSAEFGRFGAVATVLAGVAVATTAVYNAATALITPIYEVSTQFNNFKLAINAIDGSGAGAKTLEAIQGIAARTSQSIATLAQNYVGFRAATESAGVSAEQSLKIYEQFSGAFGALGLGAAQAQKGLFALTQMFSKGKVMAEEMNGQLGDALPGALGLAAEAMGVTTAAFNDMMRAGKVIPSELIPAMGKLLEVKFGDAIAAQSRTASGAITAFNNQVAILLSTLGSGNFGGVMGGLAAGMAQINAALSTDGMKAFAAALGDLIGILTNTALSAFGGFLQGVSSVFTVLSKLAGAVTEAISPITELVRQLAASNSIMSTFASGISSISSLFGALAGVWLAGKIAVLGWNAAALAAGAVIGTLRSSIMTLSQGLSMLRNAYITAGAASSVFASSQAMISGAAATAAAQTGVLQKALAVTRDFFARVGGAAGIFASALTSLGSIIPTVVASVLSFGRALAMIAMTNPVVIGALVGVLSAVGLVAYTAGDKLNIFGQAANKAATDSEKLKVSNSVVAESLAKVAETAAQTPGKIIAASAAFQSYSSAANAAQQQIAMIDQQIKINNQSYRDNAEALKAMNAPLEQQKAALEVWGVQLTAANAQLAESAVKYGMTAENAAKLAQTMQTLNMTTSERIAKAREEADAQEEAARWALEQARSIEQSLPAYAEQLRQMGMTEEQIKQATSAMQEQSSALQGLAANNAQAAAANRGVADAMSGTKNIAASTAEAAKTLGDKLGVNVSQTEAFKTAINSLNPALTTNGTATQTASQQATNLGNATEKVGTNLDSAKTSAEQASAALTTVASTMAASSETFNTVNAALTGISTSFQGIATTTASLAASLPTVSAAFIALTEVITTVAAPITDVAAKMTQLSVSMTSMQGTLPSLLAGFTGLTEAITQAAVPTNVLVSALERIPPLAPGIDAVALATEKLVTYINDAAPKIQSAAENMEKLAAAGRNVKAGFEAAAAGGDAFMRKLDDVMGKVSEAIGRMNALKSAAEAALDAANEAANAGGGSANSGRYGGFAGSLPEKVNVPAGAFNNAPAFSQGTANTSRHLSTLPGGGIPSILHPNEAVVPLPKGRSIPVDLSFNDIPTPPSATLDTSSFDATAANLNRVAAGLQDVAKAIDSVASPGIAPSVQLPDFTPVINVEAPTPPTVADFGAMDYQRVSRLAPPSSPDGLTSPNLNSSGSGGRATSAENKQPVNNITINIQAQDVDSFNRSKDQVARALSDSLRRANRRIS